MIETNFDIVLDLCIVFVVLKFLGRGREKACLLTNHKVKISALVIKATVYKLEHRWFCTVATNERYNQRADST